MNNKKGFILMETIIVTVIVMALLLILFTTFSAVIASEKEKVFYDDASYLYKTYILTKYLEKNTTYEDWENYVKDIDDLDDLGECNYSEQYIKYLGRTIFDDTTKGDDFISLTNALGVQDLFVLRPDFNYAYNGNKNGIIHCTDKLLADNCNGNNECSVCSKSFYALDKDLVSYIRTIGKVNFYRQYLIVATYKVGDYTYYTWLYSPYKYESKKDSLLRSRNLKLTEYYNGISSSDNNSIKVSFGEKVKNYINTNSCIIDKIYLNGSEVSESDFNNYTMPNKDISVDVYYGC